MKLDKHDIKILKMLQDVSPRGLFMKTSAQETRAFELCERKFAREKLKRYSGGGSSVTFKNAFFISEEGSAFLKTLETVEVTT